MECHQCGFLPIAGIIHGSQLQPGREWRAALRLFQVDWKSKQSREGRIHTEKKAGFDLRTQSKPYTAGAGV